MGLPYNKDLLTQCDCLKGGKSTSEPVGFTMQNDMWLKLSKESPEEPGLWGTADSYLTVESKTL